MRPMLRAGLALFLFLPYLIWISFVTQWQMPGLAEWASVLLTSCKQAALSAAFSLAGGVKLFSALQGWQSPRARRWAEFALLVPNMLPPLLLIMSLLSWFTPWRSFPYGLPAVIFAHALLNSGLVAIALDQLLRARLGGMVEAAWTMGCPPWLFWRRVVWPYLKFDFAALYIFVFSLCFTSFSIPLMLGGSRQGTLDVAIYDAIRADGRWDKAVLLAALQTCLLLLFAWLLPRSLWMNARATRAMSYLAWPRVRTLVYLPTLILFIGWLSALKFAIPAEIPWGESILTTAALGLSVGLLHLLLFLLIGFVTPHARLDRFLNGYLAPSSAITGFALLMLPGHAGLWPFVKLSLALTMITLPLLYRWIVHSALSGLREQIAVARTLGAGWSLILTSVIWPQAAPQLLRASGLAAFWAAGDFAMTAIVAGELHTLPSAMTGLIENYRLESAQVLMIPLLVVGLCLYATFTGAARYVARS